MKPSNPSSDTPERPALSALDWVHRSGAEAELLRDVETKVRRRRQRRLAVASLAVVALVASVLSLRSPSTSRDELASATTALAHTNSPSTATPVAALASTATVTRPQIRTLDDGSIVELNAGAEIAVAYTETTRHVTLVRGEAHFQVAKNPARPFVVRARGVDVRAVGTAFAVQMASDAIDVLVTEGRVKVSPLDLANTAAHPLVDAGNRCVVDSSGTTPRVEPVPPVLAAAQLSWRIPHLEFSRTPLHEVIDAMNQHALDVSTPRFEISDPTLRDIKLTGILRADNIDGLERLLETSFGIRSERTDGKILLRRR